MGADELTLGAGKEGSAEAQVEGAQGDQVRGTGRGQRVTATAAAWKKPQLCPDGQQRAMLVKTRACGKGGPMSFHLSAKPIRKSMVISPGCDWIDEAVMWLLPECSLTHMCSNRPNLTCISFPFKM